MIVLVTGSSGWLGRFLVPKLRESGYTVLGMDLAQGTYTDVIGDVSNRAFINEVFAEHKIEAVIHCASLHKPDIVRYPKQSFVDVNVTGTLNLLEAAKAAGHDRFIFTSTTSLMISNQIRAGVEGGAKRAFWLDETTAPLEPRNIYGATKFAAEKICHLFADEMDIAILRTSRFFPEDDDTLTAPYGPNLKANELLNRRLTVEDCVDAHICALENIKGKGCQVYIVSAPTPFSREEAPELVNDAAGLVAKYYPKVTEIYEKAGWILPEFLDRIYDSSKIQQELGFKFSTTFETVLAALQTGEELPFHHDPSYVSPKET